MPTDRIPITKAIFDEDDLAAIQAPLHSGWVVQGPRVAEFEHGFAAWTRADAAVASTSCTTALQLCMAALRVQPGDEVLVPAFTWISTANVVEHLGARAVFVDIDLRTFNIDVEAAAAAITARTVGIIPVHLFGQPADMRRVMALAERHGLWVVEDAACGFDSWLDGRHVGTFGEYGCFSFHPRKSITTGEGGMVTVRDASRAGLLRTLRDHGASRSDRDRHTAPAAFLLAEYPELGFNYRMTDIQGALGASQLRKAPSIMAGRRRAAASYDAQLAHLDWLATPYRDPAVIHGEQSYVCLLQPDRPQLANGARLGELRNRMMAKLEGQGIATRQGTHAPPFQAYYADRYAYSPEQFPNAWLAERCSLSLPLFHGMTDDECAQVVEALEQAARAAGLDT